MWCGAEGGLSPRRRRWCSSQYYFPIVCVTAVRYERLFWNHKPRAPAINLLCTSRSLPSHVRADGATLLETLHSPSARWAQRRVRRPRRVIQAARQPLLIGGDLQIQKQALCLSRRGDRWSSGRHRLLQPPWTTTRTRPPSAGEGMLQWMAGVFMDTSMISVRSSAVIPEALRFCSACVAQRT